MWRPDWRVRWLVLCVVGYVRVCVRADGWTTQSAIIASTEFWIYHTYKCLKFQRLLHMQWNPKTKWQCIQMSHKWKPSAVLPGFAYFTINFPSYECRFRFSVTLQRSCGKVMFLQVSTNLFRGSRWWGIIGLRSLLVTGPMSLLVLQVIPKRCRVYLKGQEESKWVVRIHLECCPFSMKLSHNSTFLCLAYVDRFSSDWLFNQEGGSRLIRIRMKMCQLLWLSRK